MMCRKMKSSTHIEGDLSEECSDTISKTKTPICSSLLTLNEGTTMVTMIPKPFVETRPRCPVPQTWMINNYFSDHLRSVHPIEANLANLLDTEGVLEESS
jgi:hypothetical protein